MQKLLTTVVCAGIFLCGLISTANAALQLRMDGMVYDTDRDIDYRAITNSTNSYENLLIKLDM